MMIKAFNLLFVIVLLIICVPVICFAGGVNDSRQTRYEIALAIITYPDLEISLQNIQDANDSFKELASYKDSAKYTLYTEALLDIAQGNYDKANIILNGLSEYHDFCEGLKTIEGMLPVENIRIYVVGRIAEANKVYSAAIESYISGDVLDAVSRVNNIRTKLLQERFAEAVNLENTGLYVEAMTIYQDLYKVGYSDAASHCEKISNWFSKCDEAKSAEASGAYFSAQAIYYNLYQDGYSTILAEYDRVTAIVSNFAAADAAMASGDYVSAQNQFYALAQAGYIGALEKFEKLTALINAQAAETAGDYISALAAYKSLMDSGFDAASNLFANLLLKKRDEMNGLVNAGLTAEAEAIFANLVPYIPDLPSIVLQTTSTPVETPPPEATTQPVPVMEIVGNKLKNVQAYQVFFNASYYAANNPDVVAQFGADEKSLKTHWLRHGMKEGRSGSPVLDVAYYLQMNPDVANAYGKNNVAVQIHFYENGIVENRVSSPIFNAYDYMALNPDVVIACQGDIRKCTMHYNDTGYGEGRQAIFSK